MTTLWGSPPGVSARTLDVLAVPRKTSAIMWSTSPDVPAHSTPRSYVAKKTGIPPVYPEERVPLISPFRASVFPWLKMMAPTAPAAAAFSAFSWKVQAPRWISAMSPAGKPAKSAASHPLVDAFPRPSWRSTAVTPPVTSPGSVWAIRL